MFYYFALYVVRTLLWLRCRMKISGIENVPRHGGGFLVANHSTVLDPVIIGAAITKRNIAFMAKRELFAHWGFSLLISKLGAFPVDRAFTDKNFIRQVTHDLSEKHRMIVIFGEGTRNRDSNHVLLPLKSGFAFLSKRAGTPAIPVYVSGASDLMSRKLRPILQISFGKPIYIKDIQASMQEMRTEMERLASQHQEKLQKKLSLKKRV